MEVRGNNGKGLRTGMQRNSRKRHSLRIRLRQDNCNRKDKKPGLDSRGSSLIEVIVAMLVLAMIILPMLDMFTSAGKTNARARSRQYANSVLENVLEELGAGNYTFTYSVPDAESSELRDLSHRLKLYSNIPDDGVLSGKTFLTGSIPQGTKEYQAQISFDASDYHASGTGLNDYEMPDINSYDTGNSEMILLDSANDSFALSVFYHEYTVHGEAEYQQRLNDAWLASEAYLYASNPIAWYEMWKEAHSDTPDAEPTEADRPVFDESSVPRFYPLSEELFKAYVKRDTVVTIEDAGEGEYTIRYTMRYSVDASAAALNLDTEFIPQPQDYEMSSGSRYTAEDLKYLYIFYEPFSVGMDTESLVLNAVAISTEDAWSCRLYLAVQEGKATGDLSFQVLMDAGLTADECEARLQILSAGGLKNLGMNYTMDLVPLRPAEDKVYRVTVRIMETDTGEVVAQADTTVYYE